MKEIVAVESRDQADAREKFKEWLNANPGISQTLNVNDVTLHAVRVQDGTSFRYTVRFNETAVEATPEMRRKLAEESYEKKVRRVGELISMIKKEPKLGKEGIGEDASSSL